MEDSGFSAAGLQAGFMVACLALCLIVYTVPWFDLRSLRRMARRREMKEGEATVSEELLDRPDLGAILNLLVIVGTGLAMLIGWRVPAEIERIYGSGASFGILFPSVEMTTMGRGAQVIGAVCLGLIALRLLRLLVVFAAAGMAGAAGVAALDYVFELGVLSLL